MVILFDLNGTLLDTGALAPEIRSIFGRKVTVEHWFTNVLQHTMSSTLADYHREFGDIAVAVLEMMAHSHDIEIIPEQVERVRKAMLNVPPFPDVEPALKRLRKAGFRLAVLTNSGRGALPEQLQNAGLRQYFDQTFSVESVGLYKPAPEVYRFATEALGSKPADILMVAAHHWDLVGAARTGMKTAFIERPGHALLPGSLPPNYRARDLNELAAQLLRKEQAQLETRPKVTAGGAVGIALGVAAAVLIPTVIKNNGQ